MQGPIAAYLAGDHDRLDRLLEQASGDGSRIDQIAYAEFRSGLLHHIRMEETVLLPAALRLQGGRPIAVAERIRLDHGALTALMVPPPDRSILNTIRAILQVHNALEEQEGGMYNVCEQLAGDEADALLLKIAEVPDVPLHPHNPKPEILEATRRAVERAGHTMKPG
ncbi:MAG TPA: hemerythrin domain-containing protein [Bacteroidota bacterium]|nr:hemerythrin domain-containing protein [Bacteroidota bacterium]